jgi:hypothetical protein
MKESPSPKGGTDEGRKTIHSALPKCENHATKHDTMQTAASMKNEARRSAMKITSTLIIVHFSFMVSIDGSVGPFSR